MNSWIDVWLTPWLTHLGLWSLQWAFLILILAAWLTVRRPRSASIRAGAARIVLCAGLALPLIPQFWGPVVPSRSSAPHVVPVVSSEPTKLFPNSSRISPRQNIDVAENEADVPGNPSTHPTGVQVDRLLAADGPPAQTQEALGAFRFMILVLGALWGGGVLLQTSRLVVGWFWLSRVCSTAALANPACESELAECCRRMGVTRQVRLAEHAAVDSPVLVGGRRPHILVPATFGQLAPESRRAILLHELAHVLRRDDVSKLLEEIVRSMFFFHPLVYWLLSSIAATREELCDDVVIGQGIAPRELAGVLLEACRVFGVGRPALLQRVLTLPFFRRRSAKDRIHALMEESAMSRWKLSPSRGAYVALGTLLGGLALLVAGFGIRAEDPPKNPNPSPARSSTATDTPEGVALPFGLSGTISAEELQNLPLNKDKTAEVQGIGPVAGARLPTVDEILQIHRSNKQRLSQLHLQLVHRYETTEAFCRKAQQQADEKEKIFNQIAKSKEEGVPIPLLIDGKPADGEASQRALEYLGGESARKEIQRLRNQTKPYHVNTVMEFFLNGEDYQFREPAKSHKTDEELKAWKFTASPLTAETLLSDFRDISIYSRSTTTTPAARWWHHSAGKHAYVMQKHLGEVRNIHLSPFTDITHPDWGGWHPYDAFFSQSADQYRVVREEEIDGRLLTVVEVAVPIHKDSTTRLAYRGWLDLKRGALPIRMYHRQNAGTAPADQFDRWQPAEIITTNEVRELQGTAFYPVKIISEHFDRDPDAPQFTKEELAEVVAGTRNVPMVVDHRNTWDCTRVEIKTKFDDGFFVIPFPVDQQLFDHDSGKMIGALAEKPLVRVGQQAPPLTIARWLDDKQRTLDELKGQVVVLDFWGLWCGACRSSVPQLKAIQDRFRGKPVTFISIHTAERDQDTLAAKIREFKKDNDWHYIGAIDQGQMHENSVTVNVYGCLGFPLTVIIGPDGKIAYVDPQDVSMDCDEENPKVIAEFEKKFDAIMKQRFESVGETWPLSKQLDEKQQEEIRTRVEQAYIVRQIELALANCSR